MISSKNIIKITRWHEDYPDNYIFHVEIYTTDQFEFVLTAATFDAMSFKDIVRSMLKTLEEYMFECKMVAISGDLSDGIEHIIYEEIEKEYVQNLGSVVPEILEEKIPNVLTRVACPGKSVYYIEEKCSYDNRQLLFLITHLNDVHKWTREHIADWLETLDVDLSFKVEQ